MGKIKIRAKTHRGKMLAFLGMMILGVAILGVHANFSRAQSTPRPLIVSDIDSIEGMSTNNPLANYPAGNSAYAGQEVAYDNEGISIFMAPTATFTDRPITTGIDVPECGHLGIQEWKGANYAYKLFSNPSGPYANQWQKRRSPCSGIVVIGSSGQIRAQTLTIKGTSTDGKPFTLQVNVPDHTAWDAEVGGGSRRLYVDDTGATYSCYSSGYSRVWPNECEFSVTQALQRSPVGSSLGTVAGNGLCQVGETYATAPQDCPAPDTTPPTLSGVYDSGRSFITATYNWTTSEPAYSQVEYGFSNMYGSSTPWTTTLATSHQIVLSGLEPGRVYYTKLVSKDAAGNSGYYPGSFATLPPPFNFSIHSPPSIVEAKEGSRSKSVFKIENTFTSPYEYGVTCSTMPATTNATAKIVTASGEFITNGTSTNVGAGETKYYEYSFDVGTAIAPGTVSVNCRANRTTATMDDKSATDLVTVIAPVGTASDGLVGYWKFDGNGNNEVAGGPKAVAVGGASFKPLGGKYDGGAYIQSSGDYIKIPYSSLYDLPTNFTIEFWFRQRADRSFAQDLVTKGNGPNNYNFRIFRQLWNQYNYGPIIAGYTAANTGNWSQVSNPNQLAHNTWHHVAFTKDSAGAAYYLDGAQTHYLNYANSSEYSGSAKTPAADIYIGNSAVDTDFDNLKIYRRALSDLEIRTNSGFTGASPPMAPTSLSVTTDTSPDRNVVLTWVDNSGNENGFNIYRKSEFRVFGILTSVPPNTTRYMEPTLPAGTYEWKVTATTRSTNNDILESAASNVVGMTLTGGATGTTTTSGTSTWSSAPEPTNDDSGVWAQIDVATGQIVNSTICRRSTCGQNGEYHGYVPPSSYATGSVWWPTSKRYIWQMPGQAGYGSGSFNFNTNVFTVTGGTIYNGVFTSNGSTTNTGTSTWTGTSTSSNPNWVNHTWQFTDGTNSSYILNRTDPEYLAFIAGLDVQCRQISISRFSWKPGAGDDRMDNWRYFGIPDCSGNAVVGTSTQPPPGPWIDEKHKNCDMTIYNKNAAGQYVDEQGRPAPDMSTTPGARRYFKFVDDHYHICSEPEREVERPICGMALTDAYNPMTGECRTFNNTCIPDGWVRQSCKKVEDRECGPSEMPSSANQCRMPSYRWNIKNKTWEKCDFKDQAYASYVDVKGNAKAVATMCNPMVFDLEQEWRTERYLMYPPEIYGDYWPSWTAGALTWRYDPEKDDMVQCDANYNVQHSGTSSYIPCNPMTEKDRSWILKKARAEYKMSQLYSPPRRNDDDESWKKMPVWPPVPQPIIELPVAECKKYLIGQNQTLTSDKRFWREVNRQLEFAGDTFQYRTSLTELLSQAKQLIFENEKLMQAKKCDSSALAQLQKNNRTLHEEIFPQLSTYLAEMFESGEVAQCQARVTELGKQLAMLAEKTKDEEAQNVLRGLVARINAPLNPGLDDEDLDPLHTCRTFLREIETQSAPYRLRVDDRVITIVDRIRTTLGTQVEKLTEQLEQSQRTIDDMVVKIANLQAKIEEVTKGISLTISTLAEKVTTSYTALARIEEKYAEQKTKIQAAKERLIALIEDATNAMNATQCVSRALREKMVKGFETTAAVNWLDEEANALAARLNLFISSCKAKELTRDDVLAFNAELAPLEQRNLEESHEAGLTPFKDVPTHEWFYGGMLTCYNRGCMTQGRPADTVIFADALLMVMRAAGFTDKDIVGNCSPGKARVYDVPSYAACAFKKAVEKGLNVEGNATRAITRSEVAQLVFELGLVDAPRDLHALDVYVDLQGLDANEQKAIASVIESGVMIGQVKAVGSTFEPSGKLTRASLAVILDKLFSQQANLQH